jgi:hypothetical protein
LNDQVTDAVSRAIAERSNKPERAEWLRMLARVVDAASLAISALRPKVGDEVALFATPLYYTILDLCSAIELCAREQRSIAVPTLGRQMLDAYVDLINCFGKQGYVQQMLLADAENWAEQLKQASRGDNPFLRQFSEHPSLPTWRASHAAQIAEAKRKQVKRKSHEERFELADMSHAYFTVWKIFSADLHNNVTALINRHVEAGDNMTFVSSEGRTPYEMPTVTHACEVLINATDLVHKRYGDAGHDPFGPVRADFHALTQQELQHG